MYTKISHKTVLSPEQTYYRVLNHAQSIDEDFAYGRSVKMRHGITDAVKTDMTITKADMQPRYGVAL